MNTMTHDMTWDVIQEQQGQEIQAISDTEVDEVSGGIPPVVVAIAAIAAAGAAGYGAGVAASYWSSRR